MLDRTKLEGIIIPRPDQGRPGGEKGQSLVEMAIITPLLLLLFIGVLEVGWAIRGYVVLVNADREATRFAARGQYLDFSQDDRGTIGYDSVLTHTLNSMSEQLDFDVVSDEPNGTLIISHYLVDTGQPCSDPPCNDTCAADHNNRNGGCDCSTPDRREPDYPYDDLILHPGMPSYDHFTALYGIPQASRLNHDQIVAELKNQNDAFNCTLNAKDPTVPWSPNSVVVVEAFYDQPQLLGVPFVSNYLTDPIPLYAHTMMRITSDRGSQGGSDGVGCPLLPIALHESSLASCPNPPPQPEGCAVNNIRNGTGTGNFGWLRWTDDTDAISASSNSEEYLVEELLNPYLSMNDYREPVHKDADDKVINARDWVWGLTGNINSNGVARTQLQRLVNEGQPHLVPIWYEAEGTGSNVVYHIRGFAWVTLTAYDLTGNPKTISAKYLGRYDGPCVEGNQH